MAGRIGSPRDAADVPNPYLDFLRAEFAIEEARKVSVEQRGANVISSSAAISAIAVGIVGIVFRPAAGFALPTVFRVLLIAGLATLVLAAMISLWTVAPRSVDSIGTPDLHGIVTMEVWCEEAAVARARIARLLVDTLIPIRDLNIRKARCLQIALFLEVCGVLAIVSGGISVAIHQ